jgi:arabinofuranan 3-O-arabinosyltransferase
MMMSDTIASRKTLLLLISINALVYLFFVRTVYGTVDFRVFYTAGEIAQRTPSRVYDLAYQRQVELAEFSDTHFSPYFHPPHELLLFLPLSKLPYAVSLNAWRLLSVLCLALSGILIGKATGLDPLNTALLAASMYPVGLCLFLGQDSLLLLLLVCACFYLLRNEQNLAAALVLSLALFKPQIPVVLAVALLAIGKNRFFAYFAAFGAALAAGSVAFVGREGIRQIITAEKLGENHLGVAAMPTVRGAIAFAAGDHPWLAAAAFVAVLIAMFLVWRKSQSLDFAVSSAICVAGAFTPYLFAYDLVLLGIPLALIAQKPKRHDGMIGALLTSAILLQLLYFLKAPSLLVIPTLALGILTFRLRVPEPAKISLGQGSNSFGLAAAFHDQSGQMQG